ncbi:MAG: type II and III secretion system protein [Synergistaceae bacterium]|jgi:type IV pilus assembly protein PilQ|nr:type II and III secretion system protein [Synergistaceae bacterium]
MDEKKHSSPILKMAKRKGHSRLVISLVLLAAAIMRTSMVCAADLPPGRTMNTPTDPVLSGIQVMQAGGDAILLRARGFSIPRPRAASAPGADKLVLQWDGVRFPQSLEKREWWDDRDWDILKLNPTTTDTWWKQYDLPLLNRINVESVGENGMKMIFTSTKPLVVQRIEGLAGADDISLMLRVYEREKPAALPPKPAARAKNDPMGINAPVTLQLRDADVKSVFRMLADLQNLNLLIDTSVPDVPVTFSFNEVPFKEAFSYLLRAADLTYAVEGGMLIVGRPESLGKTLGKEIVRAYNISYAIDDSGQVRGDITAVLTGLISLSKPPTLDARNRQLYVTATPDQHVQVAELLSKLDHPGRQIMLQARIFEVNDDASQELEALVSSVYDQWLFNFSHLGVGTGYNYSNIPFEEVDFGLPVGGRAPGSDILWEGGVVDSGVKMLSAGLTALESNGRGKSLASPSIITLDGQEANVSLTRNVKYASGVDSNGNVTFSDEESGPMLTFTPVIGRDEVVTIKISVETGEILQWRNAGLGAQAPETSSRRVETTVRVRNGEPFAVGGLFTDNKTTTRQRIPVLGYIPLLGDLFTARNERHIKSEVAIIVIPYILNIPDEEISTFDLLKTSLSK